MRKFFSLLLLLLAAVMPERAGAKQYHFSHLSTDGGLSHNSVIDIGQDHDGFIWIATRDGLNRYDGTSCKIYKTPDNGTGTIGFYTKLHTSGSRMLVATVNGVYYYDKAADALRKLPVTQPDGNILDGLVRDIATTADGDIYVLTSQHLYRFSPRDNTTRSYPFREISAEADCPKSPIVLHSDSMGRIWIGGGKSRLSLFDPATERIKFSVTVGSAAEDRIQTMSDNGRMLYIGLQSSGIVRYDTEKGSVTPILLSDDKSPCEVHSLTVSGNTILAGTENGLYIYDDLEKSATNLRKDYFDPHSLSDNSIYAVCRDRNGGVWIGTYFTGVDYLSMGVTAFLETYYPLARKNSISGNAVREIIGDSQGGLWIGTEDAGLNRFDPSTGLFTVYSRNEGLSHSNIHGLAEIEGQLYVGIYSVGLDIMDLRSGRARHSRISHGRYGSAVNSIYSICRHADGTVWIGTDNGIYTYDRQSDRFNPVKGLETVFAHQIMTDSNGNIWAAASGLGCLKIDPQGRISNIADTLRKNDRTRVGSVISVYEDSRGGIWFSTLGTGIFRYGPQGDILHLTEADGLPNNVVHRPVEDLKGDIWFGTNDGLVRYDPRTRDVSVFSMRASLPTNQFNYSSSYRASDGRLYFGTVSGLVAINPAAAPDDMSTPNVLVSDCWINNELQCPDDEGRQLLKQSILCTKHLKLPHNKNSLTFQLSVLNFDRLKSQPYTVMLDGHDRDRMPLREDNKVSYSNLKPGNYTLRAIIAESGSRESDIELLHITVRPPWWSSICAYILYFMAACCIALIVYRRTLKNIERRQQRLLEEMEHRKEAEIHQSKMVFFTNITHEIKTPLSLIKVPLEYMLHHDKLEDGVRASLEMMDRNVDRLITLTNQLLDFRKVEADSFPLHYEHTNVNLLLQSIYERFSNTAEVKHIEFLLHLPDQQVSATVDVELLTKIVSNLFNNAVKYCDSFIEATLVSNADTLSIEITNDGELVPPDMTEKIFEPFVHLETRKKDIFRSGLGLPLARSLARLQGGTLVCSPSGSLNRFVITLPLSHTIEERSPEPARGGDFLAPEETGKQQDTLLIVEDNDEMRAFLSSKLRATYRVLAACDGRQALNLLGENIVDLVISDIMMPEINGIELMGAMKADVDLSHIPIILLTARTDYASMIEGLDKGADAYIEKPFSYEHLQSQIGNLLQKRGRMKEQFMHQPLSQSDELELSDMDRELMNRIDEVIEENISNQQFNIDTLAASINMSRSSFHRKIKGMLNLTPNEYLRLYRLKRAAQMMQSRNYIIKEVALQTGFTSTSYFSKVFQAQFGISPREYVKNAKR